MRGLGAIPFLARLVIAALVMITGVPVPARAAEPIRLGFSMALTGGVAANGKQILIALQIWRDDVNAAGGLLGRPVELVYYDDQSNPATVPSIYAKLLDVDKVDLVIGPYATNMIAAALPIIIEHNKVTVGFLGLAANSEFHYPRYFSMVPTGPDAKRGFSEGFFRVAMAQTPKPRSVAITGADAEFGKNGTDGAREDAQDAGLEIVYDKRYAPNTTDFAPVTRAIQASNADLVFVAAYPPDTVGMIRAAAETGLSPKMFGGTMIGLLATAVKMQLGPLLNGVVNIESFLPSAKFVLPGTQEMLRRYQALAPAQGVDPLGHAFAPFGYAAGQVLAAAVAATGGLDPDKLGAYIHGHDFSTVVGNVAFGPDGEWVKPRVVTAQFQNVTGNGIDQFRSTAHEAILWPPDYKSGQIIYPYSEARK